MEKKYIIVKALDIYQVWHTKEYIAKRKKLLEMAPMYPETDAFAHPVNGEPFNSLEEVEEQLKKIQTLYGTPRNELYLAVEIKEIYILAQNKQL